MTRTSILRIPNSELRTLLTKFLKFGVVGASGMVVHGGVLYLMKEVVNLNPFVANTIGFICAATTNYILNRIWTFRSHENQVAVEYLKFILVSIIGLGINNGTLWLGGKMLPDWNDDWRFYILWVFAVGVTTLWNFFGNLIFTFKQNRH
ncbi:MAG: GtrA family protein [Bacteroidales bacterium]|nr:GtrA family protein [Bacteroidales bacterium]